MEIYDDDGFLSRSGGSSSRSRGRALAGASMMESHALIHYLPRLDKATFCALHSQFSEDPEVPLFALKTLSRFMGYHTLQMNSNKVLLLERSAVLRIFGYAPGFQASRAGYFLCFSSYVIASKEKDVKLLGGYNRKKYPRYRGDFPTQGMTKRLKK